jgi:hypothetical protein
MIEGLIIKAKNECEVLGWVKDIPSEEFTCHGFTVIRVEKLDDEYWVVTGVCKTRDLNEASIFVNTCPMECFMASSGEFAETPNDILIRTKAFQAAYKKENGISEIMFVEFFDTNPELDKYDEREARKSLEFLKQLLSS